MSSNQVFSVMSSNQVWQLFWIGWTILLPTVIYNLDSSITAKYSKRQASFYSMQDSFRFHSLRCCEILVLRVWWNLLVRIFANLCAAQRFEPAAGGFIKPRRFRIIFPLVDTSPISRWPSLPYLGRDTDHNSTKLVCYHPLTPHAIGGMRWLRLVGSMKW